MKVRDKIIVSESFIKQFNFDYDGYISDIITKRQIRDWRADTPVFIDAQTGQGKTTLVFETILPVLQEIGGRMLIACSRQALKNQYKRDAAKLLQPEMLEDYTDRGLDKQHSFGIIDVYSYQEIDFMKELEAYAIVIFDECHFFVNDAFFSKSTYRIYARYYRRKKLPYVSI